MKLHTTEYDDRLNKGLKHLQNYPQLLPFIGCYWNDNRIGSQHKILFIGESHYLSGKKLNEIKNTTYKNDWYNNNSKRFNKELADSIDTRGVVDRADWMVKGNIDKALSIFYNIKKELLNHLPYLSNEKQIFPFFSFYNYFQKPAFIKGASIKNTQEDDAVVYKTLKFITLLIKPCKIIFLSSKACYSFYYEHSTDIKKDSFKNIIIDYVPHPGCAWWNKKANAYGGRTGRGKFISLINN
ncbi:MAG: hypothetical protein ABI760_21025 [Ferruginibacter sp.]